MKRFDFNPNSPRCGCSVCGTVFLTHVSFDQHRGIKIKPKDEEAQDSGACWTNAQMLAKGLREWEPGVWGNGQECATADKYKAMRAGR
jgi:hypothetical protein